MKRFVTYLYECERGNKAKNVGFIRVKVKEHETQMELYIRNFLRGNDTGKIDAFIYEEGLRSIPLGEIQITDGKSDRCVTFSTDNIMESGYKLDDIEGIGIQMKCGAYIVSCWRDTYEAEMMQGEFKLEVSDVSQSQEKEYLTAAEEVFLDEPNVYEEKRMNEVTTYEKINLSQIRDLPSPNWHLSTNSFLLHGFWNYGYLVLKKKVEGDEETLSLGVPGIFEKPEAVMAVLFGFPKFQEITQEQAQEKMVEDTEPKAGAFGGWFVELKN